MENLLIIIVVVLAVAVFWLWRKSVAAKKRGDARHDQWHDDRHNEWRDKFEQAQTGKAVAVTRAEAEQKNVVRLCQENEKLQTQRDQDVARIAELKTELDSVHTRVAEEKTFVEQTRKNMRDEFQNLAQHILEDKGKKFSKDSAELLSPLRDNLEQFRKRVDDVHAIDVRERASLKTEIKNLQNNAVQMSEDTNNLVRALKGDSKTQGNWGEITLAVLLEKAGLREGEEYQTQQSVRDDQGNWLRPDVVINLPDKKHLIVDSKVSLRDYSDSVAADDEDARQAALKRHVQAVRNHVTSLSGKHYARVQKLNAPDFVFMFMPIEPAFFAALSQDQRLFSDAYDKNIILCAPTTLMATLRTVERIWQLERQNRNAEEIAHRGGLLYDKFHGFVEDMDGLKTALGKATGAYDAAFAKLKTGSGNLIGQAQKLHALGVNAKKPKLTDSTSSDQ
ncbi:DNA recombination protein RmuC [Candidatus Spongiihabitans sp.]|uniref:DNA recombination protein RmuC n=1 Tax=Candidatus Spongiihabitans sp. TaxID=3101308 RepID=UPI003C6FBF09